MELRFPFRNSWGVAAPPYGTERELFYCWELHGIIFQGRKVLAAVNASNCYTVVLCGISREMWKKYPENAKEAIREGLLAAGYTVAEVDCYFYMAGDVAITKTHGRRSVAGLNRMMDFLWAAPIKIDENRSWQKAHCHFANTCVCRAAGFEGRGTPLEFLEKDMRRKGIV